MYDGTANTLEEETPTYEKLLSDYMEGVLHTCAAFAVFAIAYYWMV